MRLMKRRASGYAVFASQTALWGRRNAHMTRSFTPSVPFPAQDLLNEEEIEKQFNHQAITDQLLAGFNTLHEHHTAAHGDKEGLSRNQSTSEAMRSALGFSLVKRKSTIPDAGFGLFLDGEVSFGTCVCIYPGVVYRPGDPVFFPSLFNKYLIRRSDGCSIDGRYWGISKYMYKSIVGQLGSENVYCDCSWLAVREEGHHERNPLGWGHLINHSATPNVMYFEHQFSDTQLRPHHYSYLPNIYYNASTSLRTIVLMAMRKIGNEELFVRTCG